MKNIIISFALVLTLGIILSFQYNQKTGEAVPNIKFTVTTEPLYGTYGNNHILAIWIADSNQKFVKTIKKRALTRQRYLYDWNTSSLGNLVDATTGATLSKHETHIVNWNCTNIEGIVVPDGKYYIKIELTDANKKGITASYAFTKGKENQSLQFQSAKPFKNIAVEYTAPVSPIDTNTNSIEKYVASSEITVFPNPIADRAIISLSKGMHKGTISIYDIQGKKVKSFAQENMDNKSGISWDAKDDKGNVLPRGVYFLKYASSQKQITKKLILSL